MKILILSQYFPPDVTAAAYRIFETAVLLKKRGHEVVVITSTPHKGGQETLDESVFSDQELIRVSVQPLSGQGVKAYLDQYLGFSFKALVQAIRLRKRFSYDVVWVSSPPLFVVLASLGIQLLTRRPSVLDIRDIWPESAVGIGKVRRGSLMETVGKWLEVTAYKYSSALTCVSKPMKEYIKKRTKRKVDVVYNGVAMDLSVSKDLSAPDDSQGLVFCYSGNLGYAQGLESVVTAFAEAMKKPVMEGARLDIVGTGVLEEQLREQADTLGLTGRVRFCGVKPKSEAMTIMSRANVLLIPLVDSDAFEMTVPSKVFDCMSIGRPIIGGLRGEGAKILEESEANIVVPPEDVYAYSCAFVKMCEEWNERSDRAYENEQIVNEQYTRQISVDVLEKALASITHK